MIQKKLITSFLVLLSIFSQTSLAWDEMRGYGKESWDFESRLSYLQITHNYLSGNQFEKLPSGFSYRLISYDFGVRWTPNNTHGFYLTSQVAQADSTTSGSQTYSNSSLTQATIGTDWLLYESDRWEIIPHLSLTVPFKRVDSNEEIVLNSEGALQAKGEIIARTFFWKLLPFFSLGGIYRDEGRAALFTYSAGAELEALTSFWGASLSGYAPIAEDEFTTQAEKREKVSPRNGASMNFYAVNPSLLEANFFWRNDLGHQWGFKGGLTTSLTGSNRGGGWSFSGVLNYRFLGKVVRRSSERSGISKKAKFEADQKDGVKQELFESDPTIPRDEESSEEQVFSDIEQDQKKKKKKSTDKELEQILNETQDQVELRNLQKKKNRK